MKILVQRVAFYRSPARTSELSVKGLIYVLPMSPSPYENKRSLHWKAYFVSPIPRETPENVAKVANRCLTYSSGCEIAAALEGQAELDHDYTDSDAVMIRQEANDLVRKLMDLLCGVTHSEIRDWITQTGAESKG